MSHPDFQRVAIVGAGAIGGWLGVLLSHTGCIVSEQDGAIRGFRTVEWTTKRLVVFIEALHDWEQPIRLSGFLVKEEAVNRVTCTEGGSTRVTVVRNECIGVVVCREVRFLCHKAEGVRCRVCREVPARGDGLCGYLKQVWHILELRAGNAIAHDERMSIELTARVEVELIGWVEV